MDVRKATPTEVIEAERLALKYGYTVRFRHFTREIHNPRAANGVSHRQHSRSKIRVVDGIPHVKYQGELKAVTGTFITLDNGHTLVADIRIDSEYLK